MSFTMTFDSAAIDDSPLARFSWTEAVTGWLDAVGPKMVDALKEEAPVSKSASQTVQPGRLKNSIRYERDVAAGDALGMFYAPVPYTPFVINPTRPHVISAVAARALMFTEGGTVMFRKTVNHPGTKGNPFEERVLFASTGWLRDAFQDAITAQVDGDEGA